MAEPVEVYISFDSGASFEPSLVTSMGPGVYRLEESPLCSEVASFGDVIEAEQDDVGRLRFRRVVSRAELRTYRWLLPKRIVESEEFRVFCDTVIQAGGMWERVLGGVVMVHLPPSSDYDPEVEIKRIIQAIGAEASV